MTTVIELRDFLNELIKNNKGNYEIRVQYRKDGGVYYGTDELNKYDIEINDDYREVIL